MANNEKQTTSWLTYMVQKWHMLPSAFDKQLRNSSTTMRNNLLRKQQHLRNSSTTRPQQIRNSSTTHPPTPDVRCSRRRQNFVSHEAEYFAQRKLSLYTSCRQLFGNFWPFEQLLSNLWFRAFFRHFMVFRTLFRQLFSIRENISFLCDKNLFLMHFLSNKTNKYPC